MCPQTLWLDLGWAIAQTSVGFWSRLRCPRWPCVGPGVDPAPIGPALVQLAVAGGAGMLVYVAVAVPRAMLRQWLAAMRRRAPSHAVAE